MSLTSAGRRNFGEFIGGYVEPMKARYVGVSSGRDLGECSSLAAVTWGQRASIGGLPQRLAHFKNCLAVGAQT